MCTSTATGAVRTAFFESKSCQPKWLTTFPAENPRCALPRNEFERLQSMKRVNQRQPKSRPQHGGGRTVAASSSVRLPGRLQFWSLARLTRYRRNPHTHSPQQINRITASILEYGFTNPILVDREGGIV